MAHIYANIFLTKIEMLLFFARIIFHHIVSIVHRKTQNTVGQKKKKNIYFNTNYRTEMKSVPIIKHYCPLQFGALKFFLKDHLHGESQPNFNFFN